MNSTDQQNRLQAREVEDQLARLVCPLRTTLGMNPGFVSAPARAKLRETVTSYEAALSLQTQWEVDAGEYLTPRYFELTDEVNTLLATLKQRAGMR